MASPILYVELLTVGRRRRYFLLRVVYALLLLVTAWFCYLGAYSSYRSTPLQDQAEFAFGFFTAFSWIQLSAVVLLTPAMLAGTLASEHERRTIDYLLTTPMSDWEIALGKFMARFGAVALQLAVGWPILAIFMTLGGVGPAQLAGSFAVALLSLTSTASLSLAISARAKKSREAITRTYLVLIALLTIPPMAAAICELFRNTRDLPLVADVATSLLEPMHWLTAFNPFVFLIAVVVNERMSLPIDYMGFAIGHLATSALLLFSAVVGVRRFYLRSAGAATRGHDSTPVLPQSAAPATPASAATGAVAVPDAVRGVDLAPTARVAPAVGPSKRSAKRRAPWGRTLGENPMLWKELVTERSVLKLGVLGRIAAFLLYGSAIFWILTAFAYSLDGRYWFSERSIHAPIQIFGVSGVPMISMLAMLLITSRAAGSLTSEKEQDTWITLLSTPLGGREIVRAKIFGALSSVRYWYYLVGFTWVLCTLVYPPFVVAVPFLAVAHGLGALFCACIGVRASLKSPTSLKAMGGALATVLFGAGIAPLIVSGMFQTGYLTPFSLPAWIVYVHMFFMILFSFYGELRPNRLDDEFFGFCVVGAIAFCVFLTITWIVYRSAIDRFDEFAGRVAPRPGGKPTSFGPPVEPPADDGSAPPAVSYG